MKKKFLNKLRWEKAFKHLIPVHSRKPIEEKNELTEADLLVMAALGPHGKEIENYKVQKKRLDEQERIRMEQTFPNRIDKAILWPIYSKNEKLFAQYSKNTSFSKK